MGCVRGCVACVQSTAMCLASTDSQAGERQKQPFASQEEANGPLTRTLGVVVERRADASWFYG